MPDTDPRTPPAPSAGTAQVRPAVDPAVIAGYAVGVGAVFVATLGVFWSFWDRTATTLTWGGGSFLVGAIVGALWGLLRRGRV